MARSAPVRGAGIGLKLVCDICGKEVAVDGGGSEPRAYAVAVSTTVHGWFAIWVPRYELPAAKGGKMKPVAAPLSGDLMACSPACAEKALARLNREQLEAISRAMEGNGE